MPRSLHCSTMIASGGFRPGPQFCSRHKYFISLRYQILENWANLQLPLNAQKLKVLQLQEGFVSLTSHQRLCPWTPLGAPLQDPRYRLALPRSPRSRTPRYWGLKPPLMIAPRESRILLKYRHIMPLFFFHFSQQTVDHDQMSEFWTCPSGWDALCLHQGICFHLRPRRCSALYSPWWTLAIAAC